MSKSVPFGATVKSDEGGMVEGRDDTYGSRERERVLMSIWSLPTSTVSMSICSVVSVLRVSYGSIRGQLRR